MIKRLIHSCISRCLIGVLFLVYSIPIAIIMCIPRKHRLKSRLVFFVIDSFYRAVLFCLFIPISIHGKENIPHEPAIFIANHQSSIDIPLFGSLVHGEPHVWLARADATAYKIIRYFYSLLAVIVDLSSPVASYRSIRTLLDIAYETKAHLMLFPEGERHTDGRVHEFVNGFVFLAKKTRRPVVPICILGVNYVYPPKTFLLTRLPIHVLIGEPFVYQEDDTDESFKEKIISWYNRQIRRYE